MPVFDELVQHERLDDPIAREAPEITKGNKRTGKVIIRVRHSYAIGAVLLIKRIVTLALIGGVLFGLGALAWWGLGIALPEAADVLRDEAQNIAYRVGLSSGPREEEATPVDASPTRSNNQSSENVTSVQE